MIVRDYCRFCRRSTASPVPSKSLRWKKSAMTYTRRTNDWAKFVNFDWPTRYYFFFLFWEFLGSFPTCSSSRVCARMTHCHMTSIPKPWPRKEFLEIRLGDKNSGAAWSCVCEFYKTKRTHRCATKKQIRRQETAFTWWRTLSFDDSNTSRKGAPLRCQSWIRGNNEWNPRGNTSKTSQLFFLVASEIFSIHCGILSLLDEKCSASVEVINREKEPRWKHHNEQVEILFVSPGRTKASIGISRVWNHQK